MAGVGVNADSPEARFTGDNAGFLKRIQPVAGQPLHFSIDGEPNYRYIPYWEVTQEQTFTCFPVITAK